MSCWCAALLDENDPRMLLLASWDFNFLSLLTPLFVATPTDDERLLCLSACCFLINILNSKDERLLLLFSLRKDDEDEQALLKWR
jgi:hypothetical protein